MTSNEALGKFMATALPSIFKRRIASRLGSGALEAEAHQTRICAYLSAILLIGLGLNAWLGWWWADPFAGLLMVPLIGWEGWEAVRGHTCCDGWHSFMWGPDEVGRIAAQ